MGNKRKNKRKLTIGILAHVDAGKTTLSEALLYRTGTITGMGRVDHGYAFLDTDRQEKERGITIFSKQAEFNLSDIQVMLLDTPGHVDFSAEMERTLPVLDYAILVISGSEGIQGHTVTLWKLLGSYQIPIFIFVNKMDLCIRDIGEEEARAMFMQKLRASLGNQCIEFERGVPERIDDETFCDELAVCHEDLMEEYLDKGFIGRESLKRAILERKIFPSYFGSALKMQGIEEFLEGISTLAMSFNEYAAPWTDSNGLETFAARVYKITRNDRGQRLTHLKILSGKMTARMTVDDGREEKINQIRIYSGLKYRTLEKAEAGSICAVTGFTASFAGQLLSTSGSKEDKSVKAELEAVMSYGLILPPEINVRDAYIKVKELQEEDPQLKISWNDDLRQIQIRLMGTVQLEVLRNIIEDRFGFPVEFGEGVISYRETLTEAVAGAGHFEPLRHYAEVHLLLEPLPRGRGIEFASSCSEDELDRNWQRLIMTHLMEKEHRGPLTGSPITDVRITILAGRAHLKHTESGDFRQATYRAVRQALRKSLQKGTVLLLEP